MRIHIQCIDQKKSPPVKTTSGELKYIFYYLTAIFAGNTPDPQTIFADVTDPEILRF